MKTAATPSARQSVGSETKGGGTRKPFFTPTTRTVQTKPEAKHDERVQASLNIGRPGDRYEVEADRVADRVIDGKTATHGLAGGITPIAQRKADADEELQAKAAPEEEIQTQAESGLEELDEEPVQAKADEVLQAKSEDELQQQTDDELQAKTDEEIQTQGKPE